MTDELGGEDKMRTILRAVLVMIICSAASIASTTQVWEQRTFEDFEKGEANGISITSDGKLQLAPPLELTFETGEPYAWALARDSKGRVFISSGNGGKVFVFTPTGSPQTGSLGSGSIFFKAPEMEVHALAVDQADNLYVGTSPDGKVYRVSPDGKSAIFFEPRTKYIWAMAMDTTGNLYVATGDKGELFRVDPQGKGTVVYKSGDKHIRTLVAHPTDGVIAGTEGRARIVHISRTGTAFVLYDAPVREITSIAVGKDGAIYATGIGATQQMTGQAGTAQSGMAAAVSASQIVMERAMQMIGTIGQASQVSIMPPMPPADAHSSEIYAIAPDGYPRRIWKLAKATAFSIIVAPDGNLLVGTGDRGMVYKVQPDGRASTMLVRTGGSQVTALLSDLGSRAVYAATSNLGRLYRIGSGYAKEGSYESQVKDAGAFSKWGRIRWRNIVPAGASLKIYTRSGNTREPDNTWSQWSDALTESSGQQVTSPQARFFQWKVTMASNADSTPVLDSVELAYLPRNVAPEINSITFQQRDLVIERMPVFQDQQVPQVIQPTQTGASSTQPPQPFTLPRITPTRTSTRKGWQTISWDARDDNNDTLIYSVYIKGEGETQWRLLKDNLEDSFLSWDTANFPDGAYVIKIVASDLPSNPPGIALESERISERFYIDNTAPAIMDLSAIATEGGRVRVRFRAADTATPLSKAEYSVDGGPMRYIFPVDGICDSETEDFDFSIQGLSAGEHVIAIKVADRNGNQGSAKTVVSVK
jgi:hypothetical protein